MNLPPTINYPSTFLRSPSAGFDGIFDWSWTDGCFGDTRIKPMDFDGVVERKGQFIIFETKDVGVPIPKGQLYTLEAIHRLGCFTVVLIYGKKKPETAEVWYPGRPTRRPVVGIDRIKDIVRKWYAYADGIKKFDDEERAAICEYEANLPRGWAESFAALQAQSVPAGMPTQEWHKFINAFGTYLDLRRPWHD